MVSSRHPQSQTTTMRFEKTQDLLRLAFEMQGAAEGLSLGDIMEMFGVKRRSAERMRDAVCALFPEATFTDSDDGFRRWRIPVRRTGGSFPISTEELTVLSAAAKRLQQDGRGDEAKLLEGISAKLRTLLRPESLRRFEPDLELLMRSEGLALRPGPRPKISTEVVRELREAIKGSEPVRIDYLSRSSGNVSRQEVHPYGFLYGNRHYLVAFNTNEEVRDYRLFSLANIRKVERLGGQYVRDEAFDLDAYAARSFGVYQEEPVDVVWRATGDAVADARDFLFHPTQTVEEQPDGSLLIRFRAGGLLEMCWHLFSWGGGIEVLEPPELVSMVRRQLRDLRAAVPVAKKGDNAGP